MSFEVTGFVLLMFWSLPESLKETKPDHATCRELPTHVSLSRPGFPRYVVLLVLPVWALDSDVSPIVANEALALLLEYFDLLFSKASNLV